MTPQQKGGRALADKQAPANCPRCGREFMFGTNWYSYIGHLGMHSTADKYFNGDMSAAGRQMAYNLLAMEERGKSWSNGAWLSRYKEFWK